MAIIHQYDKRSGITYAYESIYWDEKRKLIGRIDPDTGEIVPTDGRCRKNKTKAKKATDYKELYGKKNGQHRKR
jgi:hypothetical protein